MDKKERILGSLVGFAIGDAMGATTEFMDPIRIKAQYGTVDRIIGGGWLELEPGAITDDTQMTLIVYRAMHDCEDRPQRTLEAICRGFRAWADNNPPDVGGACLRAIYGTRSCKPEAWIYHNELRQAKRGRPDQGNGGLMRCLVPCLAGDLDLAHDQSYLTHSDPIHEVYITLYYELIKEALEGKRLHIASKKQYPTGHVMNTERNAEFWFLSTRSFKDAIVGAVNDGGDADTIAALTGGLAGAYYGMSAIPAEWVNALDPDVYSELEACANWLTK